MPADSIAGILAQHPAYYFAGLTVFGLVVGSFLNVVILRTPKILEREWTRDCRALLDPEGAHDEAQHDRISLSHPASHCPVCKTPIKPWENIPVISYLLLRGRCSNCGTPIGLRYPAVELLTAVATITVGLYVSWSLALLAYLLFTWCLIALAGIDIDTQLLPDDLTVPLLWGGLLFNLVTETIPLYDAVIGAMAGYLLLWSIYWLFKLATGKEGMGYGDFKLLAALGAWLGWQSIPLIILISSAVGAVIGIAILSLKRFGRDQPLPFGPYLSAAGWIALLWGEAISARFFPGLL